MSQKKPSKGSNGESRPSLFSTSNILLLAITHIFCFVSGTIYASSAVIADHGQPSASMLQQLQQPECKICPPCVQFKDTTTKNACPTCPKCPQQRAVVADRGTDKKENLGANPLLSKYVRNIATGMAHTTKADFSSKFKLGVPYDKANGDGDRDVLLIYSKTSAMPNRTKHYPDSIDFLSAEDATENCEQMHVLFHHRGGAKNLCLAIVPQYESFHVQNWMRLPKKGPGGREHPLRMVGRGQSFNGVDEFGPPSFTRHTQHTWERLKVYIETHKDILKRLRVIVNSIKKKNMVIVMVVNFGQAQLMENFVCSAKSRGFDLSNVLLFVTDEETQDIARGLNLTTFYDEQNFGHMTKEAAQEYGDAKFVQMMMAKVLSVHLVSLTGVDFLFQDVDLIWFKHPMDFFLDETSEVYTYDAIFQDDGARSVRYQPYAANSGFYFIRNNPRTQYFLTQLVMYGDLIMKTFSHQQALVALLAEHSSLFGLKVHVLPKEEDDFPGGVHYHQKGGKSYFKRYFAEGQTAMDPWIFHMSWTLNKDNKLLYLRQLGEWYVHEQCIDKKLENITIAEGASLVDTCCSAEALFSCHYKDKPSKYPCHDSPAIDKMGNDFWRN